MSVNRKDGRKNDELRQVRITPDFVKYPLGSVLVEFGDTKILCAAIGGQRTVSPLDARPEEAKRLDGCGIR